MPSSSESRYIRLEVISGKNLRVPSDRIPAGAYVSINVDSRRRWKLSICVLSSDEYVAWGNAVTISPHASPALSVEIRASYEAGRMLGSGEVIGKLQMSWDKLLDHGDEPFDLSFSPVFDVHPSLMLKAAVVDACDDQDSTLSDSLVTCKVARDTDVGHARFSKYVTRKRVSHLKRAVQHFRLVLDQCPVGHPDHAAALTNLAYARLGGCIQNHLQDIDATTSLFHEALALRPQGHPDHASSLYNLIRALNWCYSKESTTVHIHESAQLCCKLLPLCLEGTYLWSVSVDSAVCYMLNNLPIDASDEGIHLRRNILQLCPVGYLHRHRALHQLAQALEIRFKQCGSIDDIDETVQLHCEAVSLCPEGDSDCGSYPNNLALSLVLCFDHQGKPNDLDEAISLHEEALHLFPVGHESRGFSLGNLGGALLTHFHTHSNIDDITQAISLHREALTLHPPGHPHRDTTLNNLALALTMRYDKLHISKDLNEAIDWYRESLRLMRHDYPECHVMLYNLSAALCSHFTHTRGNEDVEEAIHLCQESLEALPSLHPDRYFSYGWLQRIYTSRYMVQHNPADLSLAVDNSRLASGHPTQGFPNHIQAALHWVTEAESHQHDSALETYQAATAFRGAQSLPVDAMSCAIRRDDLRRAVELMEHGRGQHWSLALRLRTPLEDLESTSLKLAATEYRRLARQWEAAVAEIRDLQGFSWFLLPPSYDDLQVAAHQGPVIILIASQYSCSTIIISTSGDPHHIPLPSVSLIELNNLKDRFTRAIRHASIMGPKVLRNDLIVLLRTVWDAIMLPIVNVLENVLKLKHRSRIWLCPTAAFTSIPLHAAHPFQTKADGSKEPCLEDLYICSYTPTLSALVRSRQMMKRRVTPSFATIGQGQLGVGKGKALLAVDSELELVHKLVPATANQNTWVHLACHGKQDPTQPYNSHFVMKDEHLTLLNIMDRDIPHAEFAFLSACHTAVGDEETPNEVIHLAAGLQFSGFKSVIGTLWEVNDAVAKHVVEVFHKYMFMDLKDGASIVMDCTRAAWALNRATHAVKMKVPLEQRMVFIHIGV
ncbi:CHAT domain-containing protein [Suillus subluteus]|nr:CHAT domain-containing protein [Suillus subluteus]